MTDRDEIDNEAIEAYRARKAPAGLAARIAQAADATAPPRNTTWRWAIPAAAAAVIIVALAVFDTDPGEQYSMSVAVSLSDIQSRSLTISTRRIGRMPSLASVRPLPSIPKLDLDFSDLKAKRSSATKRREPMTLPN